MAQNELPPMAPGGQWLHSGGDSEPHYVAHEAHIKRLLSEGWQPAADPRKPVAKVALPADAEKEEMKQRIAKLEAMLAQVLETKSAPEDAAPSEEPASDDDQQPAPDGKPARKPRR